MSEPKRLEAATAPVIGLSHEYPPGSEAVHVHERFGQIMYAVRGAMTVSSAHGCWVLPPQRALWIPPGIPHSFSHSRPVSLRTVYVREDVDAMPPWRSCTVLHVSALVRELILAVVCAPWDYARHSHAERLARVLLDQLTLLKEDSFYLPEPRDARAMKAASIARGDPGHLLSLQDIARRVGASDRTLDRLFAAEAGVGFGAWRRNLRLLLALERLANGEPVGLVASAVGYENPSSFVAMFKATFGATPAKYFARPR
ncbi:HTH-type transcriptional regulator NimR [Massilia sp. Bi118]|nr:HTH-type transcriptional regulator NimR [Massilia sp. Bi118]